ncbi:unnamed protein product [Citrullus colocynthis]|uniref:NAC domain-containing protein n=1 Tax=Citrullus colocynthis TaxID=252529 RepID=A0ABP0YTK5_9ROSI
MDSSTGCLTLTLNHYVGVKFRPMPLNHYVGVKFRPTDQQLLHYLHCKTYGLPYFQGSVFDFDLYGGTEPWEILKLFEGIDGEDLYFFTKLKRSITNSGRLSAHINRKIGLANATWSGENSPTPIFANDAEEQIIGYCKRFRYENEQLQEHHGEWIMHEYSLHPNYLTCEGADPSYVLCRMRKNERVKRKLERPELQQPRKKRITAPKISCNERSKTEANERAEFVRTEQRVMTPEMIYNAPVVPDMSTNQDVNVVAHMPDMTTNQDNIDQLDMPLMLTNESTSFSIGGVPYVSLDDEFLVYLNSILT